MIVGAMTAITVDEVHGLVYWSDYLRVKLNVTNPTNVYRTSKFSCVTDQMVWCIIMKHSIVLLTNTIG